MQEETWKNGKLLALSNYKTIDGEELSFGTLNEGFGHRITYYENGRKYSEGPYKNGVTEGEWRFYDERERLLTSGQMKNGFKEGIWKIYTKSGRMIKQESYERGQLIETLSK